MVWYLHEKSAQPVEQLPFRVKYKGQTRTAEAVYQIASEIGYTEVPNPPTYNEETHKVVWNTRTNRWNKKMLTADELQHRFDMKWAEIRRTRNDLLDRSDWSQISSGNGVGIYGVPGREIDAAKRDEYKDYRQALRDITKDFDSPEYVVWPIEPV
jgi:hypothetical protein